MKTSKFNFPVNVSHKLSIFGGDMDLTQLTFTFSKSKIQTHLTEHISKLVSI